ncbi:MAG: hypothetical protein R2755_09495 [Acidimicrobiales bacterium]
MGVRRHFLDRLTPEQQAAIADALGSLLVDDPNNVQPLAGAPS